MKSRAPHEIFLANPRTRGLIADYLGARVPAQAVDDLLQLTRTRALAAKRPPTNPKRMPAWVLRIAHDRAVDYLRHEALEEERVDPDTLPVPGCPEEMIDYRRAIERVVQSDADVEVFEWLKRHNVYGEDYKTLAEEAGLSPATVRQRTSRLLARLRKAAGLVAFLFFLVVCGSVLRNAMPPKSDVAHKDRIVPDTTEAQRAEADRKQRAKNLRTEGFKECDAGQWQACLDALDAAKALDPAGDDDDRVYAARVTAAKAFPAKPVAPRSR